VSLPNWVQKGFEGAYSDPLNVELSFKEHLETAQRRYPNTSNEHAIVHPSVPVAVLPPSESARQNASEAEGTRIENNTIQYHSPYVAMLQSSGSGKTRLLKELSREPVVVLSFTCPTHVVLALGADGFLSSKSRRD
jgi:hypothetical protein